MSYIIPIRELDTKEMRNYREAVHRATLERALALGLSRRVEELYTRDLLPSDFGLKDWSIPTHDWIRHNITAYIVIGIYKVLQLGAHPTASLIRFKRGMNGAVALANHGLEGCYAGLPIISNLKEALMSPEARDVLARMTGKEEVAVNPALGAPMEGYLSEPIVYDPQDHVYIDVEIKSPSDNYLVLGGFVAERIGTTVV